MRYIIMGVAFFMLSGCVDHEYSKWTYEHGQLCWKLGGTFDRNPYEIHDASIRCIKGSEVLFIKKYKGAVQ